MKIDRPKNSLLKEIADDIYSIDRRIECAIITTGNWFECLCVTCNSKNATFWQWCTQLWHCVLRWVLETRYDRRNTHWQCFHCNSTYMNGKKWEQRRHARAIDRMYWPWTSDKLFAIEEANKNKEDKAKQWRKPRMYMDIILECYNNILRYKRENSDMVLPTSSEATIKKAKKILDGITRDDKYRIE